jgi:hypothetical protein
MSNEFEKFISDNREAFDTRMPDPAVLSRIQAQMGGEKQAKKGILIPIRVVRWAAACIVLLAGATVFLLVQKNETVTPTQTVSAGVKNSNDSPVAAPPRDIPAAIPLIEQKPSEVAHQAVHPKKPYSNPIDEQLTLQKNALMAKLNDMESPGERITAAGEAYALKNSDKDIVDALVKTLNSDPNTNVRMAALDALGRFHREPYVKKQLVASLKTQKDPIVQIELIQLLTKMKQKGILDELEKIVNDGNTMKAVKDHAYIGILTLKS